MENERHLALVLWFLFALALAVLVGVATSIPDRHAGLGRMSVSIAIATSVCTLAWLGGAAVGMSTMGPGVHVLVSIIFASAAASVYHAYISETPTLR